MTSYIEKHVPNPEGAFREYKESLKGFIRQRIRLYTRKFSSQDVEDIVQEVFVQVVKSWNKQTSYYHHRQLRAEFKTWVFTIAKHRVSAHYSPRYVIQKRRSIEYPWTDDLNRDIARDIAVSEPTFDDSPKVSTVEDAKRYNWFLHPGISDAVAEVITNLNEDQRIVFTLKFLGEKSYSEIGEMLSMPVGTVSSKIARVREKIKPLFRVTVLKNRRVNLQEKNNSQ